jgi:membrane protease YdiL (CAAX protease family)
MFHLSFPRGKHLGIVFLLCLFGQLLMGALFVATMTAFDLELEALPQWLYPIGYLISFVPAIRYTWRRSGRPRIALTRTVQNHPKAVAGLGFAFVLIGFGTGLLVGYLPTSDIIPQAGEHVPVGYGTAIMIVTLAPIVEEYLFRGLILERLLATRSERAAILLSALLFGSVHLIPAHVIAAALAGLALGYVYVRTRSLVLVTLLHVVNNGLSYLAGAADPETPEWAVAYVEIPLGAATLVGGFLLLRHLTKSITPNARPVVQTDTPIEDYVPAPAEVG